MSSHSPTGVGRRNAKYSMIIRQVYIIMPMRNSPNHSRIPCSFDPSPPTLRRERCHKCSNISLPHMRAQRFKWSKFQMRHPMLLSRGIVAHLVVLGALLWTVEQRCGVNACKPVNHNLTYCIFGNKLDFTTK